MTGPRAVPAPVLVLAAAASVQLGASVAKGLFEEVGPGGAVLLRMAFAALVLGALWRPRLRGRTRDEMASIAAFAVALAGMNLAFYAALDRIPLGVAVTLEFAGPLGLAVAASRRAVDVAWAAMAAVGILLLADPGGGGPDRLGVALALVAGACWAAYILLGARVGRAAPGGGGLALAMIIGSGLLLPLGVIDGGAALADPAVLGTGAAVALLSSAIPYSLELEALRRLPARVFGVLMSLGPAMAAIAGFIVLGEVLGAREVLAIALVVVASAGAARTAETLQPARD